MTNIDTLITNLNHIDVNTRLDSLRKLMEKINAGEIQRPPRGQDVNNHIHTTYSFSPYSPSKAIWMAYNAGLATAGIMDHDSISGADEFIEAGKIAGIATTIGVECRADFSCTPLNGKRINNPDQDSIAYVAIHGIPHTQISKVKQFFAPYTAQRNLRNRQMVDRINEIIQPCGLSLDFYQDIVPLSMNVEGGSITERHILYALSLKLIATFGKGEKLLNVLKNTLNLNISAKIASLLTDTANSFYDYDLLGLLKGEMVSSFYINAAAECPDIKEVVSLSQSIGAVLAYAYLGDVGDSVTGDKKSQKFEDDYLDQLFVVIKELGFNAVTYMPSRNSLQQLKRIMSLCETHGLFQISGEDINSPRQSFVCMAQRDAIFNHLIDAAWALIGHELEATWDLENGMFSKRKLAEINDLKKRITIFKEAGLSGISSFPA
ncbi:MAG: PHP domain-containing protein [Clostridia bacterium]|nr:PHP domain-containing protein [Clostridia bacterium]